eukprot:TRINITY_DN4682_c0_g2_i1.p1 TRINITY_DN4682_c0_g2~~TRINITY_DN4682_c0_g2_i1.p1  ORF type:complete len:510 (+),score=113.22 TRINITY_DN4682_c0_g2_i1:68-1597(+)
MASAADDTVTLNWWLHPTMQVPFQINYKDHPFTVSKSATIDTLMVMTEDLVEELSKSEAEQVQMQISVLWNTKKKAKALSPNETIGSAFENGDTFGVYGDVMPVRHEAPRIPESAKLPVTILTGFLGAGKTTLLNYILQEQREKKIAVIENEFGEVSIDDGLLKKDKLALAEKVVVMDNGCMCCTIRGDLLQGLRSILEDIRKGGTIDAIIIETTGMADPVPIVRTFMTSPEVASDLRLDGVVTVADAKHILARLDDKVEEGKVNEAYQQVAFCDKILLNKLDLVSSETAIAVKDRLRSINAFAKILPAVKSRVKISELTNLCAHDMTNFVNIEIEKEAVAEEEQNGHDGHGSHGGHGGHGHDEDCKEDHGHGGGHHGDGHAGGAGHGGGHADGHGHGNAAKKSRHDSRVNSMSIVREGEIIPELLGKWMQTLGTLPPERGVVFRIKAILAVKGHPFKHVFHAVMDVSDEDDAGPWGEDEKKVSKIVFIGKGLDERFLRDGFHSIFEQK